MLKSKTAQANINLSEDQKESKTVAINNKTISIGIFVILGAIFLGSGIVVFTQKINSSTEPNIANVETARQNTNKSKSSFKNLLDSNNKVESSQNQQINNNLDNKNQPIKPKYKANTIQKTPNPITNGPTGGWVDDVKHITAMCNRNVCWMRDNVSDTWIGDGAGNRIDYGNTRWGVKAYQGGDLSWTNDAQVFPWTADGPTGGWFDDVKHITAMCNRNVCWMRSDTEGKWINDAKGYRIDQGQLKWDVKAYEGGDLSWTDDSQVFPWTADGPTGGWVDDVKHITAMCNRNVCWMRDNNIDQWINDAKGYRIDQGQLKWDVKAYEGGDLSWTDDAQVFPWTADGPTGGWVDDVKHITAMCNRNVCWMRDNNTDQWINDAKGYRIDQGQLKWDVKAYEGDYLPWTTSDKIFPWTENK